MKKSPGEHIHTQRIAQWLPRAGVEEAGRKQGGNANGHRVSMWGAIINYADNYTTVNVMKTSELYTLGELHGI